MFPPAFIDQFSVWPQEERDRLLAALDQNPSVARRFHPQKVNHLKLTHPVPWCATAEYLEERPYFAHDPLFHAGTYYVQEASSMIIGEAFRQLNGNDEDLCVLDLCAAPGGKTTLISSLLAPGSLLIANEVIQSRVPVLQENVSKWGMGNTVVCNKDPKAFAGAGPLLDWIIVDAPCSGEGLFRRDHQARDQWSADNVRHCSLRQQRILTDAWASLKPGGYLLYSTCTFNPQENEDNLRWMVDQHQAIPIQLQFPESWGIWPTTDGTFGYRMLPSRLKGEGLFFGVLQKEVNDSTRETGLNVDKRSAKKARQSNWSNVLQKAGFRHVKSAEVESWLQAVEERFFFERADQLWVCPSRLLQQWQHLEGLGLKIPGFLIAERKGKEWQPTHELVLSVDFNADVFHRVELSREEALRYLKKEALPAVNAHHGYCLAMFEGVPLGGLKGAGNRYNNLYPKSWRLRK